MLRPTAPYVNPYYAGNPVYGDSGFFGRADILRQVEQILAAPGQSALTLYGQRRIGKTSVLLQFQHSLPADRYTVIYQDLQDKARQPMSDLFADLAEEIAAEVGLAEPPRNFDNEGRVFQKEFLPQVYRALPDAQHRLVFLFDEFEVLDIVQREKLADTAAANQLFPILRRWLREEPRLAFIFAMGRNLNDLDSDFLSTFKVTQTINITVFPKEETVALITAPVNLAYTAEAVDYIYRLTNGHPYFTQLLCSLCFDRVYNQSSPLDHAETITLEVVDSLLQTFFSRGENVFAWIWDGLPAAERIVTAALAQVLADDQTLATQTQIETTLQNERVRIVTRDLQLSPEILVKWGLLQEIEGQYRFLVPVLRLWIRQNKPWAKVRDEVDRLNPRAHYHYQIAKEEYNKFDFAVAEENLQRALNINSQHLQARILWGDIKLEQGNLAQAIDLYEKVYQEDKGQGEGKLLEALRQAAEFRTPKNPLEASGFYDRMLEINLNQPDIIKHLDDLQPALNSYKHLLKKHELYRIIVNGISLALITILFIFLSGLFEKAIAARQSLPILFTSQSLFIPIFWGSISLIFALFVMIKIRDLFKNELYSFEEAIETATWSLYHMIPITIFTLLFMGITWVLSKSTIFASLVGIIGAGIVILSYFQGRQELFFKLETDEKRKVVGSKPLREVLREKRLKKQPLNRVTEIESIEFILKQLAKGVSSAMSAIHIATEVSYRYFNNLIRRQ